MSHKFRPRSPELERHSFRLTLSSIGSVTRCTLGTPGRHPFLKVFECDTMLSQNSATEPGLIAMLLSLSYGEKVAFFFGTDPISLPTSGLVHSTLQLIRDDIATLSRGGPGSLAFPRAMCLMVAIDLLGKMQAGSDRPGGVGDRFKGFVEFALDPSTYGSDIGRRILRIPKRTPSLIPDVYRLEA